MATGHVQRTTSGLKTAQAHFQATLSRPPSHQVQRIFNLCHEYQRYHTLDVSHTLKPTRYNLPLTRVRHSPTTIHAPTPPHLTPHPPQTSNKHARFSATPIDYGGNEKLSFVGTKTDRGITATQHANTDTATQRRWGAKRSQHFDRARKHFQPQQDRASQAKNVKIKVQRTRAHDTPRHARVLLVSCHTTAIARPLPSREKETNKIDKISHPHFLERHYTKTRQARSDRSCVNLLPCPTPVERVNRCGCG